MDGPILRRRARGAKRTKRPRRVDEGAWLTSVFKTHVNRKKFDERPMWVVVLPDCIVRRHSLKSNRAEINANCQLLQDGRVLPIQPKKN